MVARDGRRLAKSVTSVVTMGALGVAGLGTVVMDRTINAANAAKVTAAQSSTTGPDTSGSQSAPSLNSGSGTTLQPGSAGSSDSRSSGS